MCVCSRRSDTREHPNIARREGIYLGCKRPKLTAGCGYTWWPERFQNSIQMQVCCCQTNHLTDSVIPKLYYTKSSNGGNSGMPLSLTVYWMSAVLLPKCLCSEYYFSEGPLSSQQMYKSKRLFKWIWSAEICYILPLKSQSPQMFDLRSLSDRH